jgi:predicted ATP-dependent endonuclease of OLD family
MRNVYLVSKNGETNVQLINMSEAQEGIPRELGIRLSSVFMFDRLVFVEGPTDEDVMREWASVMNINLAQAGVGFISMGGVRNLAAYATQQTIDFLSKRQVGLWFVMDRDERDDGEVKRLIESLGERANLCVLKRRELENYLIVPRALSEFIRLKRELANAADKTAPPEQDVVKAINASADLLKAVAVERRVAKQLCSPIYPDRRKILKTAEGTFADRLKEELQRQQNRVGEILHDMGEVIERQNRAVDENWALRKTEVVPGDLLLDEVCKQFGVRFNKERDSARLAALMTVDEIAVEIRSLLKDLVKVEGM